MDVSENIRRIISHSVLSFHEREKMMFNGLLVYLRNSIGEYLSDEQVISFAVSLRNLRNRPAHVGFSSEFCELISNERTLCNRFIPRKQLRKDEAALLIYNLAPYALLSRKETAMLAKCLLPAFFGSIDTINSTFTKLYAPDGSLYEKPQTISIEVMPDHSTYTIEKIFLELGSMEMETKQSLI